MTGTEGGDGPDLDPDVLEELELWGGPDGDADRLEPPHGDGGPPSDAAGTAGAGRAAAGGRVVLVGTPIGNLGDLSPRAVEALEGSDVIYCEDTRHSRKLLTHAGITGTPLRSLHRHNEDDRIDEVVAAVAGGRTVVLVSDAGMPAVSDPGARVVAAVAAAGLTVTVVPGPSAVLTALVASGLATDRFCFEGFLPRSGRDRTARSDHRLLPPLGDASSGRQDLGRRRRGAAGVGRLRRGGADDRRRPSTGRSGGPPFSLRGRRPGRAHRPTFRTGQRSGRPGHSSSTAGPNGPSPAFSRNASS